MLVLTLQEGNVITGICAWITFQSDRYCPQLAVSNQWRSKKRSPSDTNFHVRVWHPVPSVGMERNCLRFLAVTMQHRP